MLKTIESRVRATAILLGLLFCAPVIADLIEHRTVEAPLLVILGLSLAVTLGVALSFSRSLAPLGQISESTRRLGLGDLNVRFPSLGEDEVADVGRTLNELTRQLNDIALAAGALARGEVSTRIVPTGPADVLGNALGSVQAGVSEARRQLESLMAGDFREENWERTDRALLGDRPRELGRQLREAAMAAESIARGDTNVRLVQRGENDLLARSVNILAGTLEDTARQVGIVATGNYNADIPARSERDQLGLALRAMTRELRERDVALRGQAWVKAGVARMNELVLGQDEVSTLASSAVSAIAQHLGAKVGALYIAERDTGELTLRLLGTYAFSQRKNLANRYRLGEGLVGQAALEKNQITLQQVPEDYIRIASGLGETSPRHICVTPIVFKGELLGVLEMGTLTAMTEYETTFLEQVVLVVATAMEIARKQALVRAQQEEMRLQQVELEQSNSELEMQMARVRESEERMKEQQRALEVTNEELQDKNRLLERQRIETDAARASLAAQAEELKVASKYKSEFLANMSHELRTPLNSLLILARSLRDDAEGNLTAEQRESATVIYDSGNDLLNLINEILDLAKIEAGRMELRLQSVEISDISRALEQQFGHMARSQGLALNIAIAPTVPTAIVTDPQRLGQVLKNLIGNALKFTEHGSVSVDFGLPSAHDDLSRSKLQWDQSLAIRVTDTGIGIAADKQKLVFEAFQQADSGDRRRYGGTGLGLSISRELVALLGGEIQLTSKPGSGSTFTVFIPLERGAPTVGPSPLPVLREQAPQQSAKTPALKVPENPGAAAPTPLLPQSVADDRDQIGDNDRVILVIEDDARFAQVLLRELRRRGFKCVVALDGQQGLSLARAHRPSGVILDLHLPDISGWSVLTTLKEDLETRHIPVHIVSAEQASIEGLRIGAIGHAKKPLRTEDIDALLAEFERSSATAQKWVLVVEDDPTMRRETVRIIGNGNVHTDEVATGHEALQALRTKNYALLVLDLGLPDMQGLQLLETATAERLRLPPVIIYTTRELTMDEELALRNYAEAIIIKDVRSQERLIDEVALFLHRVVSDLPVEKRQVLRHLHESDGPLRGKKILIVEDDMRTMFAMAKLLASHGVAPFKAANGEQALALLGQNPGIELVLMDMMMPVMDGYETLRRMRAEPRYASLPVIALTAKAMREDRQKCIEAGATDYLAKPVDQDRLVSLLRVWLCR